VGQLGRSSDIAGLPLGRLSIFQPYCRCKRRRQRTFPSSHDGRWFKEILDLPAGYVIRRKWRIDSASGHVVANSLSGHYRSLGAAGSIILGYSFSADLRRWGKPELSACFFPLLLIGLLCPYSISTVGGSKPASNIALALISEECDTC